MKFTVRFLPTLLASLLAFLTCTVAGFAATVISPNNLATTEGAYANSYPYNPTPFNTASIRVQQVYLATDFASLGPSGGFITQLWYRADATAGGAFNATLPDIQIDMSTISTGADALSATFANNVGANNTTVFARGALTLTSGFSGPGGGPKVMDIVINLTTPFFYNPAAGNLLVDVRNFGGGTTTPFDAAQVTGDSVSRVSALVGSASGTVETIGLVTGFTIVPEPTAGSLLGLATLLFGLNRRRPNRR